MDSHLLKENQRQKSAPRPLWKRVAFLTLSFFVLVCIAASLLGKWLLFNNGSFLSLRNANFVVFNCRTSGIVSRLGVVFSFFLTVLLFLYTLLASLSAETEVLGEKTANFANRTHLDVAVLCVAGVSVTVALLSFLFGCARRNNGTKGLGFFAAVLAVLFGSVYGLLKLSHT